MYVHRSNEENQPYSCVMITPSAPPVNEEFFYPSSPNASTSKRIIAATSADNDDEHEASSRNSIPNTTYHTGLLGSIPLENHTASSPTLSSTTPDQTNDHDPITYHHYDTTVDNQMNQYQPSPSSPPPYQEHNASVPLLAVQEDDDDSQENIESSDVNTRHQRQYSPLPPRSPPNDLIVSEPHDEYLKSPHYLYYAAPRNAYFNPRWFTVSLFFFVVGLTFVITSIIMVRQCSYVCFEAETEDKAIGSYDENEIDRLCNRRCLSGSPEAMQDLGAAITGVAGFASVIQLFLLSMWQIHLCCLTCRRK